MKSSLIVEVVSALTSGGYTVADCTGTQSCFDVLARRGERTFIVKALANIEGLSNSCAQDLLRVSRLLSATPVVVGDRMKSSSLSRGVVYERHGVHVLSSETFTDYLKYDAPSVFSIRGNYCVKVNQEELKDSREIGRASCRERV